MTAETRMMSNQDLANRILESINSPQFEDSEEYDRSGLISEQTLRSLEHLDRIYAETSVRLISIVKSTTGEPLNRLLIGAISRHHITSPISARRIMRGDLLLLESMIEAMMSNKNLVIKSVLSTIELFTDEQKQAFLQACIVRWNRVESTIPPLEAPLPGPRSATQN